MIAFLLALLCLICLSLFLTLASLLVELRRANRPITFKDHGIPKGPFMPGIITRVEDAETAETVKRRARPTRFDEEARGKEVLLSERRDAACRIVGAAVLLYKDRAAIITRTQSADLNAQALWDAVDEYEALP